MLIYERGVLAKFSHLPIYIARDAVVCCVHNTTQHVVLCGNFICCVHNTTTHNKKSSLLVKNYHFIKNYHFLAQIIIFWSKIIIFLVKNYLILVIM